MRPLSKALRQRLFTLYWRASLYRWPRPLWLLTNRGTVPIGDETFIFYGLRRQRNAEWAFEARRGDYEPAVTARLVELVRPGDTVFDVGAYLGPYTMLASRLVGDSGQVVAFEPDPATRKLLKRAVRANVLRNVIIEPFAMSDRVGELRFDATGTSISHESDTGSVVADAMTLDHYCGVVSIAPDVIKMDIEGGEAAALNGSRIAREARALIVEIHEHALGRDRAETLLASLGDHELLDSRNASNYDVLITPSLEGPPGTETTGTPRSASSR